MYNSLNNWDHTVNIKIIKKSGKNTQALPNTLVKAADRKTVCKSNRPTIITSNNTVFSDVLFLTRWVSFREQVFIEEVIYKSSEEEIQKWLYTTNNTLGKKTGLTA